MKKIINTCGHILHWYFRPGPVPFVNPVFILLALIGCGTTSKAAGVVACPFAPPGELLFDEPDLIGPECPYIDGGIWVVCPVEWSSLPSSIWPENVNKEIFFY